VIVRERRTAAIAYWTGAAILTVFGLLDLVAIGGPFFLTGLAMLAVGRWRHDRAILWPALLGVWAFVLGYIALAPLNCSTTTIASTSGGILGEGPTRCSYLFGVIRYSGATNPSLVPAFLGGLGLGLAIAFAARRSLAARISRPA
jgi:hypothetical protein